jgi:hypothetical protein
MPPDGDKNAGQEEREEKVWESFDRLLTYRRFLKKFGKKLLPHFEILQRD